jgi:hypothetical protein
MNAHDRRPASAPWGAYGAWNLSADGFRRRPLTERVIGLICIEPAQEAFLAGCGWRPQQDSNLRSRLRRVLLYLAAASENMS